MPVVNRRTPEDLPAPTGRLTLELLRAHQPEPAAHCRRVAALAVEMATAQGAPPEEIALVEAAAMAHHAAPSGGDVAHVLAVLRGPRQPGLDHRIRRAAEYVEVANLFDEELSWAVFDPEAPLDPHVHVASLAADGILSPDVAGALAGLRAVRLDQWRNVARLLPVFPAAVFQALALGADVHVSFQALEKVISTDQVLAGEFIQAANSSRYYHAQSASTIRQAIVFLGLDATRRMLAAATFRPLVASAQLHLLWRHAVDTAHLMERLAWRSGTVPQMEAFLAGLVHDVGRLVIEKLPSVAVMHRRLVAHGSDPVFADHVLFGCDHGEIGARVLETWDFPAGLVEAVRFHHSPERTSSLLASLLYLAEQTSEEREDQPSGLRLDAAFDRSALTPAGLESADAGPQPRFQSRLA